MKKTRWRRKKSPKRRVELEADKLWSEHILERDKYICQRCGGKGTQAHHIFSRRYKKVRHDPDNGISLCYGCHHNHAHSLHEAFRDFVISWMGEKRFQALKVRALTTTVKYDPKMDKLRLEAMKCTDAKHTQ